MPAWLSLEPEQLIFQGCSDSRCGLMTACANGANPDLLTNQSGELTPAPTPDGSQVAFVSEREGQWAVWLLDWRQPEPKGRPVRLAPIPGGLEGPIANVSEEPQPGWWYESISWWRK